MAVPKVVIVGRPNVGKSSLLNWLAGRRISIVEDTPGVTRDRISTLVSIEDGPDPRFVELIDTGGIGIVDRDDLSQDVEQQINFAIEEADLILFVVDARDGRMPLDEDVAAKLRYFDKPVILIVNKADVPKFDEMGSEFARLGRGRPIPVSTRENRNKTVLLEEIQKLIPPLIDGPPPEAVMKIAVVGRPNTGKSTFINTLSQAERMIVSEIPGTTRDSVDVRFELDNLPFIAIDTAGVRRQAKFRDSIDFFSLHRAQRSIRRCDIVLLFIDPTQGVTKVDKQLAEYVAEQYKPCIFVVNKWDLMLANADEDSTRLRMERVAHAVKHNFKNMSYMPLAFITAKTGKNVKALINHAQAMFKQANRRVGTGQLNRVVRDAFTANPPNSKDGRFPRFYYATQVSTTPPTIVLFVNKPTLFDPGYLRYLINTFRSTLPFPDIPMKMYLRARSQADPTRDPDTTQPSGPLTHDGFDTMIPLDEDDGGDPAENRPQSTTHEQWVINQEVNELLDELKP